MGTMINCPYCGKLTDPKLDNCPHCGGYMRKEPQKQRPAAGQRQTCPNCHALVQEGDIICVACGTNLLTGQKIVEEKREAAKERRGVPIWVLIALGIVIVALIVGGLIFFLATRDEVRRAVELGNQGRVVEAIGKLEKYVERRPKDVRALLALGTLRWENQDLLEAANSFEAVSQLEPRNLDAALLATVCLSSARDASMRGRQIAVLERAASQYPNNAQVWRLLALARAANSDVPGQINALDTVLRLDPTDTGAHVEMGIALALQGNYPRAAQRLGQVPQAASGGADLAAAMGYVDSLQGRGNEAVENLRKAATGRTPASGEVQTQIGLLLAEQGRFNEAISSLEGPARDPANAEAQFFYAVCLSGAGRADKARETFDAAAKGEGPYAARALLGLAAAALTLGDTGAAKEALGRAEQGGDKSAAFYTLRARFHVATENDSAAEDDLRKAIQADPAYPPARLERGLLFIKGQVFNEGARELGRYVELVNPDAPDARVSAVNALIAQLEESVRAEGRPIAGPVPPARSTS